MKRIVLTVVLAVIMLTMVSAQTDPFVSFEANNAPVTAVLKSIAKQHELNLVLGSGIISRRITLDLKDVSLEVALNMISKAGGFSYERFDNTILVDSPEHIGTKFNAKMKIYELDYVKAADFANSLSGISTVDIKVNPSVNAIVVSASPDMHIEIAKMIRTIDIAPKQILIEAKLIEISEDKLRSSGINWDKLTSQTFIFAEGAAGITSDAGAAPDEMGYVDLGEFPDWSRQLKSFQATVDMLLNKGFGKILSNTKLVAMDNQEASIHIGDVVPYIIKDTDGDETSYQVEKEEIGIKLNILPSVSSDGNITVNIEPEVSNIYGWKGENADIPWVKTRTASTRVTVKDGHPIIIAGLQSENETIERKGLWPLSEIPFLKIFFTYKKKTVSKTDLLIQITPRIVNETDTDNDASMKELEEKLENIH